MELPTGVMLLAAAAIQMLCEIEGVRDVHHVYAWSLTSGRNLFSGHLCVEDIGRDGERVLRVASDRLRRDFAVYFSTVQIEAQCLSGEDGAAAIDITGQLQERTIATHRSVHD